MQKLEKLEDEVTEERGCIQQGQQTCRMTQKRFQEVIGHKCKQCRHYSHGCASNISGRSQVNQKSRPPVDQLCDVVLNDNTQTTINSVSNYTMGAYVFGSRVSFLIDTGAAVLLISTEVWDRIKPVDAPKLDLINIKLVGVDGVPLQVKKGR